MYRWTNRLSQTGAAELITGLLSGADQAVVTHWLQASPEARQYARQRLGRPRRSNRCSGKSPPIPSCITFGERILPSPAELARQLDTLGRYLGATTAFEQILSLKWRWQADKLLHRYGLPGGRDSARRLDSFLKSCQARLALHALARFAAGAGFEQAKNLE